MYCNYFFLIILCCVRFSESYLLLPKLSKLKKPNLLFSSTDSIVDEYNPANIRNFCIIAHIDHGTKILLIVNHFTLISI